MDEGTPGHSDEAQPPPSEAALELEQLALTNKKIDAEIRKLDRESRAEPWCTVA
jgi:hypothetical protein